VISISREKRLSMRRSVPIGRPVPIQECPQAAVKRMVDLDQSSQFITHLHGNTLVNTRGETQYTPHRGAEIRYGFPTYPEGTANAVEMCHGTVELFMTELGSARLIDRMDTHGKLGERKSRHGKNSLAPLGEVSGCGIALSSSAPAPSPR